MRLSPNTRSTATAGGADVTSGPRRIDRACARVRDVLAAGAGLLLLSPLFAVIAVLLFNACSDSSGSSDSGTGIVNVRLTDAPIDIDTVQSVNVTITGVTLYPSGDDDDLPEVGNGPVALRTHPDTFDLRTLPGGTTTLLASGEAPIGCVVGLTP